MILVSGSGWSPTRSTSYNRTSRCPSSPSPEPSGHPAPAATSAECWLTAGGPHHTVLSQAVGTEELTDFADMINTELLIIDADTDRRGFANEIRWNATAHRLGMP